MWCMSITGAAPPILKWSGQEMGVLSWEKRRFLSDVEFSVEHR